MNLDLIDKVIKPLDDFIDKETDNLPFSSEMGFTGVKIDEKNFHILSVFPVDKELTAIDGGNANIMKGANFSVDFIRIAAVTYKDKKRTEISKKEFFCLIKAENKNDKLIYSVDFYGDNFLKLDLIESVINTLDGEKYNIELSSVAGIIRRFSELVFAKQIVKENINLVMDGSIKAKTEYEIKLIKELLERSKETNSSIGFLSKTCRLLTKNASSLNSTLNELGPKASWHYYPIFKINNPSYLGEMYFVKLNSNSKYVFKLEIPEFVDADSLILSLSMNSNDPIFYGYPYALIDADRFARVTNKEKDYLKTILLSRIKNKERLRYLLSNLDAHDILDNIS